MKNKEGFVLIYLQFNVQLFLNILYNNYEQM